MGKFGLDDRAVRRGPPGYRAGRRSRGDHHRETSMIASAITHRTVEANGIRLHIAEQGEGPVVVLCHGFPESWYSWRNQLVARSAAGFPATAPPITRTRPA